MQFLTEQRLLAAENPDFAEELEVLERRISDDVFSHTERRRSRRSEKLAESGPDVEDVDDDFDGDETGVEVVYVRE